MYLARCTRPDILTTVGVLSRNITKWSTEDDARLIHLFGYIQNTAAHRMGGVVNPASADSLLLRTFTDADLGGCISSARSTSGAFAGVYGDGGTFMPIGFHSTRQRVVAVSTGESETAAAHECLKKLTLPVSEILDTLLGRKIPAEILTDNVAALTAIKAGLSSTMKYISKTQKISIAWLKESTEQLGIEVKKVDTAKNAADLFTKPLQQPRHGELSIMCGVMDIDSGSSLATAFAVGRKKFLRHRHLCPNCLTTYTHSHVVCGKHEHTSWRFCAEDDQKIKTVGSGARLV